MFGDMASAKLKEELNDLMTSMFEMEFLGDHYKTTVEYLEQGSNPSFLAEIIPLYGEQANYLLSQVSKLMGETVVNYKEVDLYLSRLFDSSLSIGAPRMTLACKKLRNIGKENNKEKFVIAMQEVRCEFEELYKKLQKMLQLRQKIQAHDTNEIVGISKL